MSANNNLAEKNKHLAKKLKDDYARLGCILEIEDDFKKFEYFLDDSYKSFFENEGLTLKKGIAFEKSGKKVEIYPFADNLIFVAVKGSGELKIVYSPEAAETFVASL